MKRLIFFLALLCSVPSLAAIPTTTVNGKYIMPSGSVATAGTITATLSQPGTVADDTGSPNYRVSGSKSGTIASDGTITGLALVPNDLIAPAGTYYKVTISVSSPVATSVTENWSIANAVDPIAIADITRLNSPTPSAVGVLRIQDEGVDLAQLGKLNLTGPAVACSNDTSNGRITCNVTGGAWNGDANADGTADFSAALATGATVTDAQVPNNITINLAATASALAADPANCSSGQAAGGITAAGTGEACIDPIVNLGTDPAGTLPTANGGTGLTSLATGRIPYGAGSSALNSSDDVKVSGTTLLLGSTSASNGKATIGPGTFILSETDNGGLDAISGANSLAIATSVTGGVITLVATGNGTNIVISPGPGGIFYVDNAQVLGSANLQNGYFVPHQGTTDPTVCTYLGETFLNTTSNLWKKNTNASPPACTWAAIGGSASAVGAARVYQRTDGSGVLQASTMSESADGSAVTTTAKSFSTGSNTGASGTGNGQKYAGNANQTVDTNCSQWVGSFGITETDDTAGFLPVICADGADYFRPPVPTATANKPVLSTTTSGDTALGPVQPVTATDDTVWVGSGTAMIEKAVPDCTDTGGNHLNYTASTNVFSCGTSSSGGGGGSGDVTDVGPGCAAGACLKDGTATSGTEMLTWEGTTVDANEDHLMVPAADPGADLTWTLPSTTTTLAGADTADVLTNKTLDVEATGNQITLIQNRWLPAFGCINGTTTGASGGNWQSFASAGVTQTCVTTDAFPWGYYAIADGTAGTLYAYTPLPSGWTGNIDVVITWRSNTTNTGLNVNWQLSTLCIAAGETPNGATFNTAQSITDASLGTANLWNTASQSSITTTGCAANEILVMKLVRDGANGSDTLAATADFIGMQVRLRETQ